MAVDDRHAAVAELQRLVEAEATAFPSSAAVWQALRTRGKLLSPEGGFTWGEFALAVCETAGTADDTGPVLAAATECLMAALDVVDDIQDADAPDALYRSWGIPTALNVAMLLLFLSQMEVGTLSERGVEAGRVSAASHTLAAAAALACSGQQEDLDGSSGDGGSEDQYLAMIGRKSASLVAGMCRAAAILGGVDAGDVTRLANFGFNVGMAMQILNDVVGVSVERIDRNDLRSRKVTLPIIFARESGQLPLDDGRNAGETPNGSQLPALIEVDQISELLEATGALEYARTVADLYWERALTCAQDLPGGGDRLFQLVAQLRGGEEIDAA